MDHDEEKTRVARALVDLFLTFYSSGHDHFSVHLFKLFAKADETNQRLLGLGFPYHYKAWTLWYSKAEQDTMRLFEEYGLGNMLPPQELKRYMQKRASRASRAAVSANFKKGDRVVYANSHGKNEDGTVTSINDAFVFVCFGVPGSTSQSCHPSTLQPLLGDADE